MQLLNLATDLAPDLASNLETEIANDLATDLVSNLATDLARLDTDLVTEPFNDPAAELTTGIRYSAFKFFNHNKNPITTTIHLSILTTFWYS